MRRDMLHRLYPLIALALLAAVTMWLERVSRPDVQTTPTALSTGPDMTVERMSVHRFDLQGRLQYALSAEAMQHFPGDDRTDLTQPRLHFYAVDGASKASADRGSVGSNGETVLLSGNVVVVRDATAARPQAEIRTEALTIWPDAEKVESGAPVTYIEGPSTVRAATLSADNLRGSLQLGGGVKATFAR